MADNLNVNEKTGKVSFFSVQEKAWHGKGAILQEHPNSAEALIEAGLDFKVVKKSLFAGTSKRNTEVPGKFAICRGDNGKPLGIVGSKYTMLQNVDAFKFFDSIVGDGTGIMYETAGALGDGEKVFITAKLPGFIKVGKDDITEKYLFLQTTHDGSGSVIGAFTPVRIVCNNTLNAALRNCTNMIRIKHTKSIVERLEQAHRLMGICDTFSETMGELFNEMSKKKINDEATKKLIQLAMAPDEKTVQAVMLDQTDLLNTRFTGICDKVFEYSVNAESQKMKTTKGTLFGMYNAITGYYQNVHEFSNPDVKIQSIITGGAMKRAEKAIEICEKYMKADNFNFKLN